MPEAAVAPLQRAQQLAGGAATLAVVGAILIAHGAIAREIVAPGAAALRSTVVTPDWEGALAIIRTVGAFIVLALPSLLLAGALLDLSKVLDELWQGTIFHASRQRGRPQSR